MFCHCFCKTFCINYVGLVGKTLISKLFFETISFDNLILNFVCKKKKEIFT